MTKIVNNNFAVECLQDVVSHESSIRGLLERAEQVTSSTDDDSSYIRHEINAWNRMTNQAKLAMTGAEDVGRFHQWNSVHKLAVAYVGKPAVYVSSSGSDDPAEETKVFDFIRSSLNNLYGDGSHETIDYMMAIINGSLIFFDTEEEQNKFYRIFDAEITDSSFVYACTYDKTGQCLTENT